VSNRKTLIVIALLSGLPSVGWVSSLILSWITIGSPLATSPGAYAPLLIVTFPMSDWFNNLADRAGNVHLAALLYTAVCSLVYAAASILMLAPVLISNGGKAKVREQQ
jgi:hypothetical protein